jgi:3-isopropylmalate/(R)-2-methylmalate dehydratase large subunit
VGYAYEYAGTTIEAMSMEERMTLCNMSIEGGARCGYVNPDQTTYDYLQGRDFAPKGSTGNRPWPGGNTLRSDADAGYDDVVVLMPLTFPPPSPGALPPARASAWMKRCPPWMPACRGGASALAQEAFAYMDLQPGTAD